MPKYILKTILLILISYVNFISLQAACTNYPAIPGNVDQNFTCINTAPPNIQVYGGSDKITMDTIVNAAQIIWLDDSLCTNVAEDGNDTLIINNSTVKELLSCSGDDRFEIYDSRIRTIYADTYGGNVYQRGNDTILLERSSSYGWILGGNDNDTITIIDSRVSFVSSGYSNVYTGLPGYIDYTPYDGNDTIILDNVDFSEPNFYYPNWPGSVGSGKADDIIIFKNGGNAFGISAGHGNDTIIVEDPMLFNDCNYTNERGNITYCGIYSDEPYELEEGNSTYTLHGNDKIILKNGDISKIVVEGGHGSDLLQIHTPVTLTDTNLSGGDDRSIVDSFVDRLVFSGWVGDINASYLQNWETIVLNNISEIDFLNTTLVTGFELGIDPQTNLPYGLVLQNNSYLNISQNFILDGNLYNNAIVDMQKDGNLPKGIFIVKNNYVGQNASLYFDVTLNDASPSISDRLIVEGDTQGDTTLYINNISGVGGQTPIGDNAGILLIEVHGISNAVFQLSTALQAGEYKYTLHKGSNGNWYLQSQKDLAAIKLVKIVDKTSISKPEVLNYTITLNNTGNIVLNTIEVTDILPNGTHKTLILQSGDTNHNNKLDLNEKWVYTTTFIATQDDIDKGNTLTNTANVTTLESPSALGSAQTQIIQQSEYSFRKKTNSRPLFIGDSLVYTFTIKNIGNTRLKVLKITDDNCKSNITLKSESSQQNGILDLNEEQIYTCTSLPITHYEANICEVINIANVAVKTNLSNSTLQEKTSKITTFINVHNSCTCETAILERSPLMPSDSNVPSLSSTSATIQWEDNAFNEIGFEIYKDNILVGTTGKDKTSFTIENLQPRTTYTYTIKSYNEYGTSYRTTITFTTKDDYAWFPAIYNLFL